MMMWVFAGLIALAVGLVGYLVFTVMRSQDAGTLKCPGLRGYDRVTVGLAIAHDADFSVQVRVTYFMYFTVFSVTPAEAKKAAGLLDEAARQLTTP
jgi:hypothetical protein